MKTVFTLSMICMLAFTACDAGRDLPDNRHLSETLLQADRDFAALSERSGPREAFAAYLASNAILIGRSGDPVEGYEQALAAFDGADGIDLYWQPQYAEVAAAGDMGWTWGRYQLLKDGTPLYTGKYVNIWTRQADGAWKVRVDMGNQEPQQP